MPRDDIVGVEQGAGWIAGTDGAVEAIDLIKVCGRAQVQCRWQDDAPLDSDHRKSVIWRPDQPQKDVQAPGGATTTLWFFASWGDTEVYVKHA